MLKSNFYALLFILCILNINDAKAGIAHANIYGSCDLWRGHSTDLTPINIMADKNFIYLTDEKSGRVYYKLKVTTVNISTDRDENEHVSFSSTWINPALPLTIILGHWGGLKNISFDDNTLRLNRDIAFAAEMIDALPVSCYHLNLDISELVELFENKVKEYD